MKPRFIAPLFFGGLVAAVALNGHRYSPQASWRRDLWYRALPKPRFTPPPRVFKNVWPALYALVALSGYRVWRSRLADPGEHERLGRAEPDDGLARRRRALALWGANVATNALWPWIFFVRRAPRAAMADLAANGVAAGSYALAASKVDRRAAWLMAPYLAWISFAAILNASIVWRRREGLRGLLG